MTSPTDAEPRATDQRGPKRVRPDVWVATVYFAQGFPYTVVNSLAEILFKELGASLQAIGLTSLFHLPWNLKFLWGPFVDGYETKRRWLLACELILVVVIALLGILAAGGRDALGLLAVGFLLLALVSATHDIAIDGYYLEALDETGKSRYVGYRAAAYRVAMLAVSGPLLWLCAKLGFVQGLWIAAVAMGLLLAFHGLWLPKIETPGSSWRALLRPLASWRVLPLLALALGIDALERHWALLTELQFEWRAFVEARPGLAQLVALLDGGAWAAWGLLLALLVMLAWLPRLRRRLEADRERGQLSDYRANFFSFLAQPRIGVILAFVILFRTGESFLQKMRWPFLSDALHMPLETFGLANGTVGIIASFGATIIGGRLIARDGLRRWIWPFMLAQNVLNLLYLGLAMLPESMLPDPARAPEYLTSVDMLAAGVIVIEHAGAGLGTAVFMVYLMRTCDPAHKAGHMAIVTALMSVSFTLAGVFSGFLADAMGFAAYFGFTFAATIPSMLLIPFIPYLDGREHTGGDSSAADLPH